MNWEFIKPWLAQAARDGLRTAGTALMSYGVIKDGAGLNAFVGAGMTLAGILWGWWTTGGAQQMGGLLKRLTGTGTHSDAVKAAEILPPRAAVDTQVKAVAVNSVVNAVAKVLLVAFVLSAFLATRSEAADVAPASLAIGKALSAGYPTKCGMYYGIGTGGNAGAVNGAAVGTQIVQGDLDAIVGYTCPFAQNAFWFAEGSFGFSNLNGSTNGLALSGPLVAIERVGAGSPINSILGSLIPNNINPALPSIPLLPAGITTSPGNGYLFVGLVEQDIGAQVGALSGHQWVVAPLLGAGLLTRASNNVMIDTWAGWQMNSNSFCPGGGSACAKLGNMARVGVSFKY